MAGKYSSKKFILPFYVFSKSIPLHSRVLLSTLSISGFSIFPPRYHPIPSTYSTTVLHPSKMAFLYFYLKLITNIAIILLVCLDCFEPFTRLWLFSVLQNNEQSSKNLSIKHSQTFWDQHSIFFINAVDILKIEGCFIFDLSWWGGELNVFSILYLPSFFFSSK